jgi:hypothetical protein
MELTVLGLDGEPVPRQRVANSSRTEVVLAYVVDPERFYLLKVVSTEHKQLANDVWRFVISDHLQGDQEGCTHWPRFVSTFVLTTEMPPPPGIAHSLEKDIRGVWKEAALKIRGEAWHCSCDLTRLEVTWWSRPDKELISKEMAFVRRYAT